MFAVVFGTKVACVLNPLAPLGIFPSGPLFPEHFLGGRGYINFKAIFKWAILKIEAKMILLHVFGHIPLKFGPILKIKNKVKAEDPLCQFITDLALFGALGA